MEEKKDNRLSTIRKHLNLTQKAFAEALEVNQGYISAIEKGKREFSRSLMFKIVEQFNISFDWLTSGSGPMLMKLPLNKTNVINNYLGNISEEKFDNYSEAFIKKVFLIQNYNEKFRNELENIDSDLYKLRQEADNFLYRTTALNTFHTNYLLKFSLNTINSSLPYSIENTDNFTYNDYKEHVNSILKELKDAENLIIEGNRRLKELLTTLKKFDTDNVIEEYLLK